MSNSNDNDTNITASKPDTVQTAVSTAMRAAIDAFNISLQTTMDGNNPHISADTVKAISLIAHQIAPKTGCQIYRTIMATIQDEITKAEKRAHQDTQVIIRQAERPILFIDKTMAHADMSALGFMLQKTDLMFVCGDKTVERAMRENGICRGQFKPSYIGTVNCQDTQANVQCISTQADCIIHLNHADVDTHIAGFNRAKIQHVHFTTYLPDTIAGNTHVSVQKSKDAMIQALGDMVHTQHATPFSLRNAANKYRWGKSSNRYTRNCYGLRDYLPQ